MGKSYQPWTQDQIYLMAPSLRDWLPEEHLAWFILDVADALDLSAIEAAIQAKDPRGQRPYHPQMMMALLLYGYCTGVFSSRKLERATHDDVACRVITGNTHPHFTTINEFRRVHRDAFVELFVQGLALCREAGLVKLGHVAIDGTKVRANASKHKAMSYQRLCEQEPRLRAQVERLVAKADEEDAREDAEYGEGKREPVLPEELRRREQRLKRIGEAKAALEAGARASRARELIAQAEGMEATAATHPEASVSKRLRTQARQRRAQAEELVPSRADDDGEGNSGKADDPRALQRKGVAATTEGEPESKAQRNFTDPDSSIMVGRDGFVQAYNCQLAADEHAQVIVALGVTDQPPDAQHLVPMLHRMEANLGEMPAYVTADAGYWNPSAPEEAAKLGTTALIATERVSHGEPTGPCRAGEPPADLDARERMRWDLETEQGQAVYARRKVVIEPVNGQIKEGQGFRRFSFRGLEAVEAEWNLVALCHNLLKLFRHARRHLGAAPDRPPASEGGAESGAETARWAAA